MIRGRHAFERLLYALVLGAAGLYAASDVAPLVFVLVCVFSAIAWMTATGPSGRPLPRLLVNSALALAVLAAGARVLLVGADVASFSRFVAALLVLKLFDRRTPRDDLQVLLLSAFLVIGAVLTTNALFLGIGMLVFTPALLLASMEQQLRSAAWSTEHRSAPGRVHGRPSAGAVMSPALRRTLRRLAWGATVGSLVLAAIVFPLIPRGLGRETLGSWGNPTVGAAVVGFAEEVQLGRGGLISDSPAAVLDLVVTSPAGEPMGGEFEVFYLRGAVLDQYEDGRWTRSDRGPGVSSEPLRMFPSSPPHSLGSRRNTRHVQEITMRNAPGGRSPVFHAWKPVSISFGDRQLLYVHTKDLLLERQGSPGKLSYTVESSAFDAEPVREPDRSREAVDFPSEIVFDRARSVLEVAGVEPAPALRPRAADDRAARVIEQHLQSSYSYTLDVLAADGDPIEWFLTEAEAGHCEYFASAMAAMCQSVGIDARVVTGYVATEWYPSSQHYVVRESNAHAWVEVEVLPGQWKTFDPTPPDDFGAIHQPELTVIDRLTRMASAIEYAWIRNVVSFDRSKQEEAMQGVTGALPSRWLSQMRSAARAGGSELVFRAAEQAFIAFAATVAAGLIVRSMIRRARGTRRSSKTLLDALRRVSRRTGDSTARTAWEMAAQIGSVRPEAAGLAVRVARSYYAERFGGTPVPESDRRELLRGLRAVR
ncbi:MAG: DUF3488 and transglutaminase-like domain-containing protein [Planctomycetota bacterium]